MNKSINDILNAVEKDVYESLNSNSKFEELNTYLESVHVYGCGGCSGTQMSCARPTC